MNEKIGGSVLRVYHLEDNPLISMFVEQLVEDCGHRFIGCSPSCEEFFSKASALEFDCVLVDIDLADGRTGPAAAAWLKQRGIPVVFVTGQEQVAAQHADLAACFLIKPILRERLEEALSIISRGL